MMNRLISLPLRYHGVRPLLLRNVLSRPLPMRHAVYNHARAYAHSTKELSDLLKKETQSFEYKEEEPYQKIVEEDVSTEDHENNKEIGEEEYRKLDEQFRFETFAVDSAQELYNKSLGGVLSAGQGADVWPATRLMKLWYDAFQTALEEEMHQNRKNKHAISKIKPVSSRKISIITIHQAMSLLLRRPHGVKFLQAAFAVGRALEAEVNFELLKSEAKDAFRSLMKSKTPLTPKLVNMKAKFILNTTIWNTKTVSHVGEFLLKLLIKTATIEGDPFRLLANPRDTILPPEGDNIVPAFTIEYEFFRHVKITRKQRVLCCPESALKVINSKHIERELSDIKLLPMLVEPIPWSAPSVGCYLFLPCMVMRAHDFHTHIDLLLEADLRNVYKALDILGKVPWRINEFIYEHINKAWEAGGDIASLPGRKDVEIPPQPHDIGSNPDSEKLWKRSVKKAKQLNNDLHSLRCDTTYKLLVAEKVLKCKFYLPHNMDFRGRAYPLPPHLNQLGSDFSRALLLFDRERELGEKGLDWLMIHLANLYGVNKITFAERIKFVKKNIDNVRDSARNPLGGMRWWLGADDPWQALATCKEITSALESPDPKLFKSRLPVHQDGSCNGLQHYAALGGDEVGGKKVNLIPSDSPQDVYAAIATIVAKRVHEDAESGHELAKLLDGKVDRKVVKQTVMTSVYGVTYIGARAQILNALQDKKIDLLDDDQLFGASGYLTDHTFEGLNEGFVGARAIMKWLANCAKIIAKQKKSVSWETPLGLPVIQPYFRDEAKILKTVAHSVRLFIEEEFLQPNTSRQRSAFPPNYVHSLDSSHMMLTALECSERDIDFASVHDSFWTHAGTVDEMNSALRKQFIELHSRPLLHELHGWFTKKYGKGGQVEFPPVPERGSLDLAQVLQSRYFFH